MKPLIAFPSKTCPFHCLASCFTLKNVSFCLMYSDTFLASSLQTPVLLSSSLTFSFNHYIDSSIIPSNIWPLHSVFFKHLSDSLTYHLQALYSSLLPSNACPLHSSSTTGLSSLIFEDLVLFTHF
jgi:hypothetical protein